MVFDDLASNPAALNRQLLEFLELSPHEMLDFGARRVSKSYRIGWLQRLLKRPPIATRALLAGEAYRMRVGKVEKRSKESAVARAVLAGRKKLLRWNKVPAAPVRLPDALADEICETLADDIAHLSTLIDRDLSHWLNGRVKRPVAAEAPRQPETLVPRTG